MQPTSQAVPYCQTAPKNAELNGLFQCQFSSADEQTFVGGIAVGSPGTIPFGLNAPVNPPGSCPANPTGPVPDGQQLVDITQDPGVPSAGGADDSSATADAAATAAATGDNVATAPAIAATSAAVVSVTSAAEHYHIPSLQRNPEGALQAFVSSPCVPLINTASKTRHSSAACSSISPLSAQAGS